MAFDPALLELMVHTCTLAPSTGENEYGEPTFGTAITPACYVKYGAKHTYADGGLIKVEDGYVILDGVYPVEESWSLTVPVPGGTRAVKITSVDQYGDEDGFHHTTVHFGAF